MHDVLAHSLAGLSVQLQAVRAVAAREQVSAASVLEPLDKAAAWPARGWPRRGPPSARCATRSASAWTRCPPWSRATRARRRSPTTGAPAPCRAEAGHAVYRAVQEALTNAARYAPGSPVTVALDWRAGRRWRVTVDRHRARRPAARPSPSTGTGLGLAGMAERLAAGRRHGAGRPAPAAAGASRSRCRPRRCPVRRRLVIRVVLADDQAVVRDGLAPAAVGERRHRGRRPRPPTAREARRAGARAPPDVALLDLRMPELDGAAGHRRARRAGAEVRVLILTTFADDDAILPALRAGAAGYLTKDTSGEELVGARSATSRPGGPCSTRTSSAGWSSCCGRPAARSRRTAGRVAADRHDPASVADGLTRREVDVVRLVAEGLSNQQIARRLVVSEATVKTHLNNVLSKLDVDGRPGLVAWAWRHGPGRLTHFRRHRNPFAVMITAGARVSACAGRDHRGEDDAGQAAISSPDCRLGAAAGGLRTHRIAGADEDLAEGHQHQGVGPGVGAGDAVAGR